MTDQEKNPILKKENQTNDELNSKEKNYLINQILFTYPAEDDDSHRD